MTLKSEVFMVDDQHDYSLYTHFLTHLEVGHTHFGL